MKAKFITLFLAIFLLSFGISFGQGQGEITLDNVTGTMWHNQPDSMIAGSTYVFNLRYNNNSGLAVRGFTNSFLVSSPDGATWTTTFGDSTGTISAAQLTGGIFISHLGVTGSLADTVEIGGFNILGSGILDGFSEIAYTIEIGPITDEASMHGKTICLDSVAYDQHTWKWSTGSDIIPSWDGPHCYTVVHEATDIGDDFDLPTTFALAQNYPNPFNPTTTINYDLAKNSDVSLTIYNITGQRVTEFTEENKTAGSHSFNWDASNVSSGVYFYKLVAGDFSDTKKMMLLK